MEILVLLKEVPDTEARLSIAADGALERKGLNFVANPFDEYAVEEGLKLKEAFGGKVTLIMAGNRPEGAKNILDSLAKGADEAVYVCDPGFYGADPLYAAHVLKAVVSATPYDIILCGKQGVDYDFGMAGIALAELLGIPHVNIVTKLTVDPAAKTLKAERDTDDGKEVIQATLPAVIACEKGLNEPRYASLKGIMGAKKKPLAVKTLADVGAPAYQPSLKLKGLALPPVKQPGRVITGELPDAVKELVKALREEAKVI
jgi:electron transfer flavoprotein beta subunit